MKSIVKDLFEGTCYGAMFIALLMIIDFVIRNI